MLSWIDAAGAAGGASSCLLVWMKADSLPGIPPARPGISLGKIALELLWQLENAELWFADMVALVRVCVVIGLNAAGRG